jgi:hypothetical protein
LEKWLTTFLGEDDPINVILDWLLKEPIKEEPEPKIGM